MKFNVAAHSSDIQQSVHYFPGDEQYTSEAYQHIIFSGYISSVATITGAASGFSLPLDTETFERWKRVAASAGLIDDFLDEPSNKSAHRVYSESIRASLNEGTVPCVPKGIDQRLGPAVGLLHNSVLPLEHQQRERLTEAALIIGSIAVKKAQCSSISKYTSLLREEAIETNELIQNSVSDTVREHPNFTAFAHWCCSAMLLGTFVDHSWDLWSDRAEKRTAVPAHIANCIRISGHAYRPAYDMLAKTSNRRATLRALRARLQFSLLPTNIAVR